VWWWFEGTFYWESGNYGERDVLALIRDRQRRSAQKLDLQYDHVIPVALGGAITVENLRLLCSDCNRSKGATI
jgi:5-methylcytosine-specific restriction endonuclease McrA